MARNANTNVVDPLGSDAPLPPSTVSSDIYQVGVDQLKHYEVEILNGEVQKRKVAQVVADDVDLKIQSLQSNMAAEDAWDAKVAEVEGKVEVLRPPNEPYQTGKTDKRKLDEAQLKVFESQRDASKKAETKRVDDHRTEPKKIETKPNDTKRL